ncbi:MAG TPA: NUDIX domain-containing protein [Modestobacter sp.]|jgi:8-oxo-dGTP pyrophosphatase MutT (NUDIX family)|nr:NUDIX domain-containing protein [Modestobacter sp.]
MTALTTGRSPTDGWTTCALGHRHWGLAGAAGLLLHRPGPDGVELLLQLRVEWSHHGGTWGTPGGALHPAEAAADGALREAGEELGLTRGDVVLGAESVDDHGGWSYTTVLATPSGLLDAGELTLNPESIAAGWFPLSALADVPLHPGFATSLPALRALLA